MTIIIRPHKRIKKARAGKGQEILDRLEKYLKENSGTPVKILCNFWKDQQDAITYKELRQAVADGSLDEETFEEWSRDYSFLIENSLRSMWTEAIAAGAVSQPVMAGLTGYVFQSDYPAVLSWVSQRSAEFITNSVKEQRGAIRALLTQAVRERHSIDELAKYIRPCIGLTEPQAKANLKYYENITRTLKEQYPKMNTETIQSRAREAAAKYAERQHRSRAYTIAQTEMVSAYSKGTDEGIRQAQAQNLLGKMVKRWCTSGDEAVCPICSSLEGKELEMDTAFEFSKSWLNSGNNLIPPAHPNCACAVEYIEVEKPVAGAESPIYTGNKEIDDAIEDYDLSLVYNNGDEAMSTRLLLSHDNVKYVENKKLGCAFMYDVTNDAIMYNRNAEHWEEYNKIYALTHENAHRVDYLELKSWQDTAFRQAIDTTSELILSNKNAIKILLQNEGYANDFAFNDLISGLTRGLFNDILFVGHENEYYKSDKLQAMEIFANLTCIDMSDSVVRTEFNGVLKPLYDAYKEVVKWKG
jgi:hypothetical protein